MQILVEGKHSGRKCIEASNPLSANPTKWSNKLEQFLGVCFWPFVGLALKS